MLDFLSDFTPSTVGIRTIGPQFKGAALISVNRSMLLRELSISSVILLRGFDVSLETFSEFVESISPKSAIDPARVFFAKNVQLVDSGTSAMGLHCENGTTPLMPNLVWFFCEKAAMTGSQTTLCDGNKVWLNLSGKAQDLLLKKRIRFSRNVKFELWNKYVRHHFPQFAEIYELNQDHLDQVFGHIDGAVVKINSDGSLYLSHASFGAKPSFFSNQIAFANSLFGPSYNYARPDICFEDGSAIPEWLLNECREVCEDLTVEIPWSSGDIALIDNTRVMHGRRAITDTSRKIYTSLGFLEESDRLVESTQAFWGSV